MVNGRVLGRGVDLGHWPIATTPATVARKLKNLVPLILGYCYLVYSWVMGRGVDLGHWPIVTSPPTVAKKPKNLVTLILGY